MGTNKYAWLEKPIDSVHRKMLRRAINIFSTKVISNDRLYEKQEQ